MIFIRHANILHNCTWDEDILHVMQAVCSVLSPSAEFGGIADLTTNARVSPGVSATDFTTVVEDNTVSRL